MQDNQRQATLYAYLAGIIDGEGTIRIARNKLKSKPHWNYTYSAHISVGMSNKEVLELFQKTFGYKISVRKECVPNRKTMYRWGTSGNNTTPKILKELLPYLIVKKKNAELVIEFCETKQTCGYPKKLGLPKEELQRREFYFQEVKKLNAVGAAATTNRIDTSDGEMIV